jgi:hypothetical protein
MWFTLFWSWLIYQTSDKSCVFLTEVRQYHFSSWDHFNNTRSSYPWRRRISYFSIVLFGYQNVHSSFLAKCIAHCQAFFRNPPSAYTSIGAVCLLPYVRCPQRLCLISTHSIPHLNHFLQPNALEIRYDMTLLHSTRLLFFISFQIVCQRRKGYFFYVFDSQ